MQLQLTKVHEYSKARDGSQPVLARVSPATRLGCRSGEDATSTYVFIQNGLFFTETGRRELRNSEIPAWVDAEISKMSKTARKEVGLPDDWKPGWRPGASAPSPEDEEDD